MIRADEMKQYDTFKKLSTNEKRKKMILLKTEVLREYLDVLNKNQNWLAKHLGFTKGYMSQLINNECPWSSFAIEKILLWTHFEYIDLFYSDGSPDARRRFGDVYEVEGEPMNKRTYLSKIRSKQIKLDNTNDVHVDSFQI